MADLYPEPPHLSAFVMPNVALAEALMAGIKVLEEAECVFTGEMLLARRRERFRSVSDIEREVVRFSGDPKGLLAENSLLRMQFLHRRLGLVALGVAPVEKIGGAHPIEITVHAGPMSLPVGLWSREDRRNSKSLVSWMEKILIALSVPVDASYGAIGVEVAFPTPIGLAAATRRSTLRPTTWYWSRKMGERAADEEAFLLACLSPERVARTDAGTLFRGWRPPLEADADKEGVNRVTTFLGRVVGMPAGG